MLETRTLIAPTKLEPSDLPTILLKLSSDGWKPALLESQRTFLRLAGVEDKISSLPMRDSDMFSRRLRPGTVGGDIFFRGTDLYYLVTSLGGEQWSVDVYGRLLPYHQEGGQASLEIGIISSASPDLGERLKLFAVTLENAIKSSLDGRKTRHMAFDWRALEPGTPHLDAIVAAGKEDSGPKLAQAKLIPEEVEAATILSSKLARETLIELSQAGFARERDILGRKTKFQDDIRDALARLKQSGLLNAEYLLECKRAGASLTRLRSPEQLNSAEVGGLVCPACNSNFSQEALSEGYSVSDMGRQMSRKSHWMTVWVTEQLTKIGIPLESILWNIVESSEEVDLLVEFLGQLWIFELKDREFGAGDAYPLNYRQVRYKANKAIIVTTEKVSKDAKHVFEELARGAQRRGSGPVYIEGIESAEDILRREVSDTSRVCQPFCVNS